MRGAVARYRNTEEWCGNTRKVYSNVYSKLKLVLSTELSNLAEGKNLERVLIARIYLSWELGKTNSQERESLKGPESWDMTLTVELMGPCL